MVVGDPEALELELQIPPGQAAGVRPGDRLQFSSVGESGRRGSAEVVSQVPQVDPTTRTVSVRARILEGRDLVVAGLFVEGDLHRGTVSVVPSVPESAVIRIGADDCVFVRLDAETFEARPVTLGRLDQRRWEIVDGLSDGEEVATEGVFLLKSALVREEG